MLDALTALLMLPFRVCGLAVGPGLTVPLLFCGGTATGATMDFGRGLAAVSFGLPFGVVERLRTRVLRLLDRGVTLGLRTAFTGVAWASTWLLCAAVRARGGGVPSSEGTVGGTLVASFASRGAM